MKMLRFTENPMTGTRMNAILSLWPNVEITQINRKPTALVDDYIRDFDALTWDCQVAEIDLGANDGDVLKFVHEVLQKSEFIKRGGILVQLVDDGRTATYKAMLQVAITTQELIVPQQAEEGEVVPIEGNEEDSLLDELKEMPEEAKDKGDKK